MPDTVKIIECPRDAWQGLHTQIPPADKADYLRKLIAAGFTAIDAVSFVSPAAVPQMADSEQVLEILAPPAHVEIIGIVVNKKGAERAIATHAVQTLGFPYSISAEFLQRNQHQTLEESLDAFESIVSSAESAGLDTVAYISMAFGNPYGEAWNADEVITACELLIDAGARAISLADTVGLASPAQIADTVGAVLRAHRGFEIGVHLHARPDDAAARIRAAYDAGCRRFDAAIGGLGGCPFAQDTLVGNIPTEVLLATLRAAGAKVPSIALDPLLAANAEIAARFSAPVQ
ncbi:MAG TPA: hydroxymethylglutaryl-CoA lyase [Terracidiphilus sp.]|jgi:hydroxymethylglutaryl-CoA lyase|nr:hydroxymethylglutaryl-CoA lyase [Terracidiphilus sp.]